ncbi:hypothetical protein BW23_6253 [Burkholderia ubonensis MSMB22]|nr:hypothetical protein BW23_6253 [Burkholderia ubonensis MSMB22]
MATLPDLIVGDSRKTGAWRATAAIGVWSA